MSIKFTNFRTTSLFHILFPLIRFTLISNIKAQNLKIGATANIAYNNYVFRLLTIRDNTSFSEFKPSGSIGFFLERDYGKYASLGVELLLLQNENTRTFYGLEPALELIADGVNLFARVTGTLKLHTTHLALPIYYKFKLKKWSAKIGVQPMYSISASVDDKGIEIISSQFYEVDASNYKIRSRRKFDVGIKTGLEYALNERLAIRADYYYGYRSPRLRYSQVNNLTNMWNVNLGANYIFFTKEKNVQSK